ncbi:MAG: NADP-dependent oxidoreductase [Chloroflexi bacterium]|nr:NADP-dependent oxidoreductase [Chloroflexota bacterium]
MKAIRFHENGGAEVLVLEDAPRPAPGEGEVLVRVHAAGVNPVDSAIRRGSFGSATLPGTPGLDLAGVVEAVGPGVTAFAPGQMVFGNGRGCYAEYALASAAALALKPANVSFDEAGSVGVGARTAWGGLFEVGGLQAGQRLLVHGAAGGVGIYAVQLGKWKGAEVVGTASAANFDLVRSLGADTVIDYNATRFETMVEDADMVFDTVGRETQERSWQVLKPGGILVAITGRPSEEMAQQHRVRLGRVGPTSAPPDVMQRIAELLEKGLLRTVIRKVFPLSEAREAQILSETGHGAGRIVLHVN